MASASQILASRPPCQSSVAHLERDRALADLGNEPRGIEPLGDPPVLAQAIERGRGGDDRVDTVL
jgi:hypothetical protein